MTINAVNICNQAFLKLGMQQIQDLEEQNKQSRTAKGLFNFVYQELLSIYPWQFAISVKKLSPDTQKPQTDYEYAFLLPNNIKRVISVKSGNASTAHSVDYRLVGEYIYANQTPIFTKGVVIPPVAEIPAHFLSALVEKLCVEFARAFGDSDDVTKAVAFYDRALQNAKNVEQSNEPPETLVSYDLINVRY